MKKVLMLAVLSGSLVVPLWAQEKKEAPMKGEGIKAGRDDDGKNKRDAGKGGRDAQADGRADERRKDDEGSEK